MWEEREERGRRRGREKGGEREERGRRERRGKGGEREERGREEEDENQFLPGEIGC